MATSPNGSAHFLINEIPPTPSLDAAESQVYPAPRSRVNSTPDAQFASLPASQSFPPQPPSAGPYRTSFSNRAAHQGHALRASMSMPSNPGHSRSLSGSYSRSPPPPSPLSGNFARTWSDSPSSSAATTPKIFSFPPNNVSPEAQRSLSGGAPSQANGRKHSRIHSRNLSVFFPRPGALPHSSIAEDGADTEVPVAEIPQAEGLRPGFTFGTQSPRTEGAFPLSQSSSSRRGHHHKHSMSHNFFSFLEPGANPPGSNPNSAPVSASSSTMTFPADDHVSSTPPPPSPLLPSIQPLAVVASVAQFILGALMWISGQQTGSLSCTGLGYWVVFDSFGIAISRVIPGYLARDSMQSRTRRSYGNGRLESLTMFGQSVYLIFSAVYICKEAVEHFLLSAGEDAHHHGDHHHHAESVGLPFILATLTLFSLIMSALAFENHAKLVEVTGRQLPQLTSLLPSTRTSFSMLANKNQPPMMLDKLLTNPFSVSPIGFALAIVLSAMVLPSSQQRQFDLLLAGIEGIVTFSLAYPTSVVLGSVLLQTSPPRGAVSGKMEAFLRVMKEIERHPQVLHLPPPHIWQLTSSIPSKQSLVVTLELHVRKDMDDDDVLKLTKWAWERCISGLGFGRGAGKLPEGAGAPEVTVGIVKG